MEQAQPSPRMRTPNSRPEKNSTWKLIECDQSRELGRE
jgi:hypothetical protein